MVNDHSVPNYSATVVSGGVQAPAVICYGAASADLHAEHVDGEHLNRRSPDFAGMQSEQITVDIHT